MARLEGQLATARLNALNAQIRPHFLFNTLHTIGQLWRSGRSDEADAMLDHLGALFQEVQGQTGRDRVPLDQELRTVERYLAIERARFRDRLKVELGASDEAREVEVPPLLLQPLVENAVRHGISPRSDAGLVRVDATVDGEILRVSIEDDGPGPEVPASHPGSGTGLTNVRERLAQLYGSAARLTIGARPGGGCRVDLAIPTAAPR
jgi:sensor histidine kinase YesM